MSKNITVVPPKRDRQTQNVINSIQLRKVAGYARVSTDKDEQFSSYEAQLDYYENYIKSHPNWQFVKVYSDEGISGTSINKRPGFQQMIQDANEGKIDLIITKSISRFARNTVDSISTIRDLRDKHVEVYFEKENIWTFDTQGELIISLFSTLAQEESRSISENVIWGQRKKLADGKYSLAYSKFLGYDKGPDGELVINPEQAEIIKRIYSMFLNGMSAAAIAKQLTSEGIKTPTGKNTWQSGCILSILSNEKYKGDALLQKGYLNNFMDKKYVKNNGEIEQYYITDDHEAIIEREVFDLVQKELKVRKNARGNGANGFSRKIICGECGSFYTRVIWHSNKHYKKIVYRCIDKYQNGCTITAIEEQELKDFFVRKLNELIKKKEKVLSDHGSLKAYDTTKARAEKEKLKKNMEDLSSLIEILVKNNTQVDQQAYNKKYADLCEKYDSASKKIEKLEYEIADKDVKRYKAKGFYDIFERLEPIKDFDEKLFISLVDHITVRKDKSLRIMFNNGMEL